MQAYIKVPCKDNDNLRIYLPPLEADNGLTDYRKYLYQYVNREFPAPDNDTTAVYSIPKVFSSTGERQAGLAEKLVFEKLHGLRNNNIMGGLWVTFFHSTCYAGHSQRNQRMGRLMIREHDFVVFAKYQGRFYVVLIEVKSNNDSNTKKDDLEKVSDAKVIKNNKRSAQHQLRDHMEILQAIVGNDSKDNSIQIYIMWPFLGAYTKDPKHQVIKRWKEDKNLHVFEDCIGNQDLFNAWFFQNVLNGCSIDEKYFATLLNRFIILSCGVFLNEMATDMMALLTQQQLEILNGDTCSENGGGTKVIYGAAGTGKTLLVLRKLEQLYRTGRLNNQNRALYICYWPGIREDVKQKMKAIGIAEYVDTARYLISSGDFLRGNKKIYKHIFMDEAEAVCLSFSPTIVKETISAIYSHYHSGNCNLEYCENATLCDNMKISEAIKSHQTKDWGELWFMIDAHQAQMYRMQHIPDDFKTANITLYKVMRSTENIFNFFKIFYGEMIPKLPRPKGSISMPSLTIGHDINGAPVYWVPYKKNIDETIANVIVDLCATKGIKPNDICVLPFLLNERTLPDSINKYIQEYFVENAFKPEAVKDVDNFLVQKKLNDFLICWALLVKGLEFKVVVMAIEDDDFNIDEYEDRRKAYIIGSRCTCMLILICNDFVKLNMPFKDILEYQFNLKIKN